MPNHRLIIFLVEDNKTISDNLTETLEEMVEVRVAHVASGEKDARAWLLANTDWALAIVDLFLADGTGLGVLGALKERRSTQRAVVLSNYVTPDTISRCLLLGADAVFDKSTDLDSFIEYCVALRNLQT